MAARISVLIPVRDAGPFLDPALRSVLAQTLADIELIAVDDGSTDGSAERLLALAQGDARVRVIRQPARGIVAALNHGLAEAHGELIARMDADDIAHARRFERQVAYLDDHPDCVAVGAAIELMDKDGVRLGRWPRETGHEAIDRALLAGDGGALIHPTALMRRWAVEAVGGYRPAFEWVEDLDLYLRLAEVGRLANIDEVLLDYRVHAGSVCSTRFDEQSVRRRAAIREAHVRRGLPFDAASISELGAPVVTSLDEQPYGYGLKALEQGNRAGARRYARHALRRRPFSKRAWRLAFRAFFSM